MLTLALDCAGGGCAVALLRGDAVLRAVAEPMARGQDARLLPLVQDVLAQAEVTFPQLERIAVLRGPGSFTGLRIGLAAARGLGLALDIPVLGLDRLALHRAALPEAQALLVVLDSRRADLFCQYFAPDAAPPFLATVEALAAYDRAGVSVTGDAASCRDWRQARILPLPEPEAVLAARQAQRLDPAQAPPLPLYLRAPDVSHGPAPATEEPA